MAAMGALQGDTATLMLHDQVMLATNPAFERDAPKAARPSI